MKRFLALAAAVSLLTLTSCGHNFTENTADELEEETTAAEITETAEDTTDATNYGKPSYAIPFGVYDTDGNNCGGTPYGKDTAVFKDVPTKDPNSHENETTEASTESPELSEWVREADIEATAKMIKQWMEMTAPEVTPLPDFCNEIPADWEEYNYSTGISFKAPAGLFETGHKSDLLDKDTFIVFADSETTKDRKTKVVYLDKTDWTESSEEDELLDDETKKELDAAFEKLGIPTVYPHDNLTEQLGKLGYRSDTRYDFCKALLSVTDEELETLDKADADPIRLMRGMVFSSYKDEAHILETDNTHIFIHLYNDDSYWVNVMTSGNTEHCLIVKAEDKDTALKIASTINYTAE